MSARANVPTSMWEDEKRRPWRSALMYLVVFFGTLLISHLFASIAHAEPHAQPHIGIERKF